MWRYVKPRVKHVRLAEVGLDFFAWGPQPDAGVQLGRRLAGALKRRTGHSIGLQAPISIR